MISRKSRQRSVQSRFTVVVIGNEVDDEDVETLVDYLMSVKTISNTKRILTVELGCVVRTAKAYSAPGPEVAVGEPVSKVHSPKLFVTVDAYIDAGSALDM